MLKNCTQLKPCCPGIQHSLAAEMSWMHPPERQYVAVHTYACATVRLAMSSFHSQCNNVDKKWSILSDYVHKPEAKKTCNRIVREHTTVLNATAKTCKTGPRKLPDSSCILLQTVHS